MIQRTEISKLQNLLTTYQLQTTNGTVMQMSRWVQDEDGNFIEIRDLVSNNNNSMNGGKNECCPGCGECGDFCVNCWNCFACCNNSVVCCRCCICV